jgi:hypothetical protein
VTAVSNRPVKGFALGAIALAIALTLLAATTTVDPAAGVGVDPGSGFVIEPPMARYLRDLDQREQREQIRDWAVIATVAKLGATPAQAAAATYELPPARLPYFDELYAFEYGRGRRIYLGERVLLFRDGDDPDPQATIGRLADRVRMENGEIPSKVEVYLVHDQRDEGTILVERAANIVGSELFSSAYGYVEGVADSESALSAWLDKTDDLAFAQFDSGRVILGGRRFASSPASNLTAEDIAALYQAHGHFDAPRAQARAQLESLPPGARSAAERLRMLIQTRASKEELADANDALTLNLLSGTHTAIYDAIAALAQPARSPGFSLDPEWLPDPSSPQHPLMLSKLRAFAADPCAALADIAKRADALEREEPDDTRRTALTRSALHVRKNLTAAVCPAFERLVSPLLRLASKVALAAPDAWESELVGYYQLVAQWRTLIPEGPHSGDDNSRTKDGLFRDAQRGYYRWIDYLRGSPSRRRPFLRIRENSPLGKELQSLREHRHTLWATEIATAALEFYEHESKAQCARYVGTEGTRVGMTMFYADLLAKLWDSTDYGLSAPVAEVPGFLSTPRIDLDPAFLADAKKNPGTRIWFGARANAVSKTTHGQSASFYFEHIFSRIYAAGNNPANPGVEVRPGEDSRRTIGWWNRHFEDVASYEPEYQRLNQIMKWTLVTAALSESNTAQYLGSLRVQRDLTFSDWQQANRGRLRFSESLPVLHPSPSHRECLPLLASYPFQTMGVSWVISGGIDSVSATALDEVPALNQSMSLGARRPYVESLAGDSVGTAVRAHPTVAGEAVEFVDSAGVPTRTIRGDVSLGTPKVAYKAGSVPRTIEIYAGDSQRTVGVLDAEASTSSSKVKLNWTDGKVEMERYNVPAVPDNLAAADRLAAKGDLVTAATSYQERIATPLTTADELARVTVIKAVQRNPTAVLKTVQQLEGRGAQLLPDTREALYKATSEVGSPSVAAHVQTALDQGLPLANKYGTLTVERGRLIVVRDIESLPVTKLSTTTPTNLSECEVYLDTRLRVGQEGLIPDTGGPAARWQQMRNVRVEEMNADAIGDLPDRIVTGTETKTTFDHVTSSATRTTTMPPRVILLQKCDGDHKTATTEDDCDRR